MSKSTARWVTKRPVSTKLPVSIKRSIRSRAVSLPASCCFSMRAAPPPSRARAFISSRRALGELAAAWLRGGLERRGRSGRHVGPIAYHRFCAVASGSRAGAPSPASSRTRRDAVNKFGLPAEGPHETLIAWARCEFGWLRCSPWLRSRGARSAPANRERSMRPRSHRYRRRGERRGLGAERCRRCVHGERCHRCIRRRATPLVTSTVRVSSMFPLKPTARQNGTPHRRSRMTQPTTRSMRPREARRTRADVSPPGELDAHWQDAKFGPCTALPPFSSGSSSEARFWFSTFRIAKPRRARSRGDVIFRRR